MSIKLNQYYEWRNTVSGEVGVEVEMEGPSLPEGVEGWRNKTDGSLRGNAFEYVFPEPVNRKNAIKKIKNLYTTFEQFQIKPSDRCGVHIHLNCRELEIEKIFNFITVFLMLEDILMHWCGDNREGNLFCLRGKDAEWIVYSLIKAKKEASLVNVTHNETFKYASLNLAALARFGSLEFRGLETPKIASPIIFWLETLLKIKDFSLNVTDIGEVIRDTCVEGASRWIKKVLGREIYNELKFNGIEDTLLESVRRIQALAFTPYIEFKKKEKLLLRDSDEFLAQLLSPSNRVLTNDPQPIIIQPPIEAQNAYDWDEISNIESDIADGVYNDMPDEFTWAENRILELRNRIRTRS